MKRTIRIAIIAMMGMSLRVSAQNEVDRYFQVNADNQNDYVASRIFLKSHSDYRGAGIFSLGQTNNWFIGNPYTDHANSFMIGVTNISDGEEVSAQKKYAKFYLNKDGKVGIGITTPKAKLDVFSETDEVALRLSMPTNKNAAAYEIKWANENINVVHRVQYSNVYYDFMDVNRSNRNVTFNGGNVGIGTADTKGFKLGVNGKIAATEVKVATYANWSDFVFYDDYQLPTLTEVENHIKEKGHLKDIPSAKEVEKNGFFLGAMDAKLLQKIEELTLYTIEQEKKIKLLEKQQTKLEEQEKKIERLEVLVKKLLKE